MIATTNSAGQARFFKTHKKLAARTLCLDNLTMGGHNYAPGDDIITCKTWQ